MSPMRPERLRALVPPCIAALCWMADVPGGPWLLLIGFAGATLVWREDGRAPIEGWAARFPRVPWSRVDRLPSAAQRGLLVRVCEEVTGADRDLRAAKGAPGLDAHSVRAELAGLVALAADLGAQLETLCVIPASDPRRLRIEETLNSIIPAVRRMRATLQRASAPGVSAHRPRLGSLLTMERDLAARQDCLDEMEDLPCVS